MQRVTTIATILIILLTIACGKDDNNYTNAPNPKACFTYEQPDGGIVSFSSGCTTNGQTYLWEFGDGGTSTEANPTYDFGTTNYRMEVRLRVESPEGFVDDTITNIVVRAHCVECGFYKEAEPFSGTPAITNTEEYCGTRAYAEQRKRQAEEPPYGLYDTVICSEVLYR